MLRMGGIVEHGRPRLVIEIAVEAGQHHPAGGQAGDHVDERGRRGDAAGRAGGDHGIGGRMAAPGLGLGGERAVAALGRIDAAFGGQDLRPLLREHGEEAQGDLPVAGIVLRDQIAQAIERHLLGLHLVEEARQLRRQARRLIDGHRRAAGAAGGLDGLREQQLAAQGGNGRRQIGELGRRFHRRGFVAAGEHGVVGIEVAQGQRARQQERAAVGLAQEGLVEGAAGAAGRQQDRVARELQRIAGCLRQQAGGERVDERHARRDR